MTDKEKLYHIIYDTLETHEISMSELMEIFFMILMEQEILLENENEN